MYRIYSQYWDRLACANSTKRCISLSATDPTFFYLLTGSQIVICRVFNYLKHHVYYVSINSFIYYISKNNFLEQHVYNNMLFMLDFPNPGHTLLPIFPSFRPMGMVGEACLPSNAYYPRTPDYTLCSGVHVCWSEHSDSSFVYGFMILDYGFGTMTATTS